MSTLKRVKKHFPQVTKVVDSKTSILVTVSKADTASGRKKDPEQCALAKACVRQKLADGAIIGLTRSYLIRGNVAIRFNNAQAISREITSFDRHHDFAAGQNYRLSKISPKQTVEAAHLNYIKRKKTNHYDPSKKYQVHKTAYVRTLKGA